MLVVPSVIGMTSPVVLPTVATAGFVLIQVPPGEGLVNSTGLPIHTCGLWGMGSGVGLTVTTALPIQPVLAIVKVISAVPADTPVTIPVLGPALTTVATAVAPLFQNPVGLLLSTVCEPLHTVSVPVMAAGSAFTVIVCTLKQPVPTVYVTTAVPAAIPVTTPVVALMLALDGLLMLQLPPAIGWLITVVLPTHTCGVPLTTAGRVMTVTVSVVLQPLPSVYVTGTKPPLIPLTTPVMLWMVP